jgi:hypothetical protein
MLSQVELGYKSTRALGIDYTPFAANFGFSHEEPHDLLFNMRLSILVSHDASKRLRLLHEVHTLLRTVSYLHKDEMRARSEPSTAPHVVQGDKFKVVTKNLLMRGKLNRKLRDRQL